MLSKKIVRFLKSGFLVISIGFSMGISGCKGNTEEPVSSEPIEMVSEKGMDDNFINIPIDIYAEATTKNKLKDMETVRKVVERFGECGYAAEYPEYPYSEVVGYKEHSDGTITLNVHVIYPYAGDSNVYMHDVTVRPLSDGGFQYVSNYIVSEEENNNITWHTPRLTEDEWNDIYGEQ